MSDMNSQRITVRIPTELGARLRGHSRRKGQTPSDLVRVALENYLEEAASTGSAFELAEAAGLIGCAQRAPKDLSTNRRHFDGFGKSK
jgi:predicted DNA-binding protein